MPHMIFTSHLDIDKRRCGIVHMRKWNYDKHEYGDYEIPEDWYCPIYCNDMDEVVNCSSCGKSLTFGDCYTSAVIHSGCGFGYPVCYDCRQLEIQEEFAHKKG